MEDWVGGLRDCEGEEDGLLYSIKASLLIAEAAEPAVDSNLLDQLQSQHTANPLSKQDRVVIMLCRNC
jgi:hypothetical protein